MHATFNIPELSNLLEQVNRLEAANKHLTILVNRLFEQIAPKIEERRYSINELCSMLKVKRGAIYRLFKKGLKHEHIGGRPYVRKVWLEEFIERENKLKVKYQHILTQKS